MLRTTARFRVSILTLAFGVLALIPATAQVQPARVFGLKGPSGVSMARLIVDPPVLSGVPASVQTLASADLMIAKIMAGQVDVGILPPNVAAKLAAAGKDIQVAAVVGEGMLSLLSADPSVHSLKDLAGKDVYVAGQGATPEYVFRTILASAGLSPDSDLSLRFSMAYPEMAQALIAGRISLAVLPEPFATMARKGRPSLAVPFDVQAAWSVATGGGNYPMTVIFVSGAFARTRGDDLRVLLGAWRDSVQWTVANPVAAGALAERADLGLKAAVVSAAIPSSSYVYRSAKEARRDLETLFSVFLKEAPAAIGSKLPPDGFYLGN